VANCTATRRPPKTHRELSPTRSPPSASSSWNAATGPKDDDGDEDEDEDEDEEEDEEEEEVTMAAALAALAALAAVDWPLSASLVPSPSDCCRLQRVKVASAG
jgi:hypothetical protein